MAEARRARAADYLSCGPMFSTPVKPDLAPRGLAYWKDVTALGIPVFAIGGITAERLPKLVKAGVDRIAVGAAVTGSENPRKEASRLRKLLP